MPPSTADFRLLDRKVVDILKGLKEKARFLRGLTVWAGFNQIGVKYTAIRRFAGGTKYSLTKMLRLAVDGITSFSLFPLRVAVYLGFIISIGSFIYAMYALYIRLIANKAIPGWASIVIPLLFLGGVQLITIGILGEYIGRIFEEVKERPVYIVKKEIGFKAERTDE